MGRCVYDTIHCYKARAPNGAIIISNAKNSSPIGISDTLRDFKKYTSKQIVNAIENNPKESRKSWLRWLLKDKEEINFWQPGNHPEEIRSLDFFNQKLHYIHMNPVRAGIVDKEEEYLYSSARDYYNNYNKKGLLELTTF